MVRRRIGWLEVHFCSCQEKVIKHAPQIQKLLKKINKIRKIPEMNYQEKTTNLFIEQSKNWPLLSDNLEGLKKSRIKVFQFDGFSIKVQYNPKRMASVSAKVDKQSIAERPCFLCSANRPFEQNLVVFENYYDILCNPYPIFHEHYTIAHKNHLPQEIRNTFADFLDLTQALPHLVTLYNGAQCGASAPDHLHFQAGNRGLLPIENELTVLKTTYGKKLVSNNSIEITSINDNLRRFLVLESDSKKEIENVFNQAMQYLQQGKSSEEPMLNLLAWFQSSKLTVLIFLREKHRPWQYFEVGEKNILISPGLMELGGTLICPLEKDFDKITCENIVDILNQVSMTTDKFDNFCRFMSQTLIQSKSL